MTNAFLTPAMRLCVLLIYEALVKVDNVIVRATQAQNTYKLAHTVCTLAIEIILSFRSPYLGDYKQSLRDLQLQY